MYRQITAAAVYYINLPITLAKGLFDPKKLEKADFWGIYLKNYKSIKQL